MSSFLNSSISATNVDKLTNLSISKEILEPSDNINYYITCNCNNLDSCETCKYNYEVSNYSYEEHYKYLYALHDDEQEKMEEFVEVIEENSAIPNVVVYDADILELIKFVEVIEENSAIPNVVVYDADILELIKEQLEKDRAYESLYDEADGFEKNNYGSNYDGGYDSH